LDSAYSGPYTEQYAKRKKRELNNKAAVLWELQR
jgi:hypothetical protein